MKPSELEAALEQVHPWSTGWALACCGWNRGEAEEVLQIAALKILDGRARYAARSSFKSFWFGVVRRTAAERRRAERVRSRFRASAPPPGDAEEADPLAATETARTAAALRVALTVLPERQREVLHLVFYADCTIEEAAAAMGVRLGTARTHYERGKRNLRARLPRDER